MIAYKEHFLYKIANQLTLFWRLINVSLLKYLSERLSYLNERKVSTRKATKYQFF